MDKLLLKRLAIWVDNDLEKLEEFRDELKKALEQEDQMKVYNALCKLGANADQINKTSNSFLDQLDK